MPAEATVSEKSSASRSKAASTARLRAAQASIDTDVSLSTSSSISLAGEQVHDTTNRSVSASCAWAISLILLQSIIVRCLIGWVVLRNKGTLSSPYPAHRVLRQCKYSEKIRYANFITELIRKKSGFYSSIAVREGLQTPRFDSRMNVTSLSRSGVCGIWRSTSSQPVR